LISACLIAKNEEADLPACLDSLRELADQIVVYDTGSTDATVEVARRFGAKVVLGTWNDDFSKARNAALAHCRGEWIVWLDADETLVCEKPDDLRDLLRRTKPSIDAWSVAIDNLTGTGTGAGFVHHAARIFRRERCEWVGRIHEQIARRTSHSGISQAVLEIARIRHTGYLTDTMVRKDKATRNLEIARREVEAGDNVDIGYSLTSLGRACVTAGRLDEAIARCTEALSRTENPITRRLALRTIAEAHLAAGRPDAARRWSVRLRAESGDPVQADVLDVKIALVSEQTEQALATLDRLGPSAVDEDGFEYSRAALGALRADALARLGRAGDAADEWLAILGDEGVLDAHLGVVVDLLRTAQRPLEDLTSRIPADKELVFLAQVVQLQADAADLVFEACIATGISTAGLAAAALVARRLPIERALVWSTRLRHAGFPSACPLIAAATDTSLPRPHRALAAATAVRAFRDERGVPALRRALALSPPDERRRILADALVLCPELAEPVRNVEQAAREETPKVSIVIPGDHRAQRTVRCLESLAAWTDPGCAEVILVERGADDEGTALADIWGLDLRVVNASDAEGYAPACNRGAVVARGDLIVFCSSDVEATGPWLDQLLAPFAAHERVGAVGGRLLFPDGSLEHAGIVLERRAGDGRLHACHRGYQMPGDDPEAQVAGEVPAVTGALMAVRRGAWEQAGGFHEGYQRGLEDVDLCLGLRHLGFTVHYEPGAVLVHHVASSASECSGTDDDVARVSERWGHLLTSGELTLPRGSEVRGSASAPRPRPAVRGAQGRATQGERVARSEAAAAPAADRRRSGRPIVSWVGDLFADHSLATVSRELCARLVDGSGFELVGVTSEPRPYPADNARHLRRLRIGGAGDRDRATVEVRHRWPPDLSPAAARRLVMVQPWEFKGIPVDWVRFMRRAVDELWTPTSWVAQCYVDAGIPEERVAVVPNGVDTDVFQPEGDPYPLATTRSFRFLYVGGTITRKGFDLLLDTYRSQFGPDDDVCLVVKPVGSDGAYANHNLDDDLRRAAADPSGPAIEVVDRRLTRHELAALYRACDVLVHPYRGEGFALPVAEAMACGRPPIVTGYGACLDFCSDASAWLVDATLSPCQVAGMSPAAGGYWLAQPSVEHLAYLMHRAIAQPEERAQKAAAGRSRILDGFTWDIAAQIAGGRLAALVADAATGGEVVDVGARRRAGVPAAIPVPAGVAAQR
jgi:glycosyltransferase involved in cell wall biosynthesis